MVSVPRLIGFCIATAVFVDLMRAPKLVTIGYIMAIWGGTFFFLWDGDRDVFLVVDIILILCGMVLIARGSKMPE
jgi:hypothetical protein